MFSRKKRTTEVTEDMVVEGSFDGYPLHCMPEGKTLGGYPVVIIPLPKQEREIVPGTCYRIKVMAEPLGHRQIGGHRYAVIAGEIVGYASEDDRQAPMDWSPLPKHKS